MVLFGCGKSYVVPNDVYPYIKEFEHQSNIRGFHHRIDNVKIYFVSDEESPDGMARTKVKKGLITIKINTKYWEAYRDYPFRREAIIMHELGHSALGRIHTEDKNSLMYEGNAGIINYEFNKPEMLDELFGV